MNSKKLFNTYSALVLALVMAAAVQLAGAQEHMHNYPELSLTVQDNAIEGPDSLEAGFYTLNVANESSLEPDLSIAKLNEGISVEQALEAFEALVASFATGEGGAEAEQQIASAVTMVGGPSIPNPAVIELEPGEYLAFSIGANEDGQSHTSMGLHKQFTVAESSTPAEAPQADLTVNMLEFAFTIPDEVQAGEQVWEVQNVGEQLHHLVLMKIQEGKTMEDIMAFMQNEEGEPPADEAGYVNVLSPNQHNFVTFDLEPGSYVALCFITDAETGQPHVALGMIDAFTVAGE